MGSNAARHFPLKERLENLTEYIPECGCWILMTSTDTSGYARLGVNGKLRLAHRVSWEVHIGPIPEGVCVLHRCDTPSCVNPNHLFLGTKRDNTQDCINKKRRPVFNGEPHGMSLLSEEDVLKIRVDKRFQKSIAIEYGIDRTTVSDIQRKKTWKHL